MTINDTVSVTDTDETRMYRFKDEVAKREYRIALEADSKPDRFFPGSIYVFFQPEKGNISIGRTPLYYETPMDRSKMGDPAVVAPLLTKAAIKMTEPVLDRLKIVAGLSEPAPIVPCDVTLYPEDGPEIDMEKPWFLMQMIAGQLEGRGSVPGEETVMTILSRYGYPELAGPSIEEEARACADALHSLRETLAKGII